MQRGVLQQHDGLRIANAAAADQRQCVVERQLEDLDVLAFGLEPAIGGGMGAAIMMGVRRGLFSNEAGLGSAPNVAAVAHVRHPANQGIVQSFSVFIDTLIICTCTAAVILLSGVYQPGADVGERYPERLVFEMVVAEPDTEPQPAAAEDLDLGGLLGHQGRLALGQDEDRGDQFDTPGDAGQEPEENERLVELVPVGVVRRRPLGDPVVAPVGVRAAFGFFGSRVIAFFIDWQYRLDNRQKSIYN